MITGREELIQALVEAYLMEKGTMEFYSEASDKATNPDAKKTYKELSRWENTHMNFLHFLYHSVLDKMEFKSFEEFNRRTPATMTEVGIPISDLEQKIEKYAVTDDISALTLAMEIEGKAYNFYRRLSETVNDNNARIVFREMMDQEIKHINYLKDLRVRAADIYH